MPSERIREWFRTRQPTRFDGIAVPRKGEPPLNGRYYTWADDARNLAMRAEEDYAPARGRAPRDHPGRCKGWARNFKRPCRAWAAHGSRAAASPRH